MSSSIATRILCPATEPEYERQRDPAHRPRATRTMESVIQYMIQHANQPLRVSTLSAMVGVSNSYFAAMFKRTTGYTPIAFFTRLRMQRACELLMDPGQRVKQIAAKLGYHDQFYFSRIFKSVTGMAPR